MLNTIEQHLGQIDQICRKHDVKRLELFGSAATDRFDPAHSDIDFFVEFRDYSVRTIADQFFGLQEDLEALLGAKVDLVSPRAVRNPFFLQVANQHRRTLYAA